MNPLDMSMFEVLSQGIVYIVLVVLILTVVWGLMCDVYHWAEDRLRPRREVTIDPRLLKRKK